MELLQSAHGSPAWVVVSAHRLGRRSLVERREESRTAFCQLSVDFQAEMRPGPDPLAVVQVRPRRVAVAGVGLVIAAAGADRPRPAAAAVGLAVEMVLLEKRL